MISEGRLDSSATDSRRFWKRETGFDVEDEEIPSCCACICLASVPFILLFSFILLLPPVLFFRVCFLFMNPVEEEPLFLVVVCNCACFYFKLLFCCLHEFQESGFQNCAGFVFFHQKESEGSMTTVKIS